MKNYFRNLPLLGLATCTFALFMVTHVHAQSGSRNALPSGSGSRLVAPSTGSSSRVPMPDMGSATRSVVPSGTYVAPATESIVSAPNNVPMPSYSTGPAYQATPVISSTPVVTNYGPSSTCSGGSSFVPTVSSYSNYRIISRPSYGIRSWTPSRRVIWNRGFSTGCSGY